VSAGARNGRFRPAKTKEGWIDMASSSSAALDLEKKGPHLARGSIPQAAMYLSPECDLVRFALQPNPTLVKCLAQYPDDPTRRPSVRVAIVQGSLEDELFLVGRYIKPNLALDLFTVEHSPLLVDGSIDPSFDRFGLAWQHSRLEANESGVLSAAVRAVLLDQFFGFDASVRMAPTGTFHIGLWFRDPADVEDSRFDVNESLAVEGAQRGGPLAMISVPVAATGLGPLCTHPSIWMSLASCLP
jgi:hypothetical protein